MSRAKFVELHRRAAAELAACRALLGPLRERRNGGDGGREYWDDPIRQALRTASPEARARWAAAERLWWKRAMTQLRIARREARMSIRGLQGTALEVADLESTAMFGLYRAAQTWDPTRSSSWPSYAANGCRMWIRRDLAAARRLPTRVQMQVWDLRRRLQDMHGKGIPGGIRAAAEWCELDPTYAQRILSADVSHDAYLDAPAPGRERQTLRDTIEGDATIEDEVAAREERTRLAAAMEHLDHQARAVLELQSQGLPHAEIGERVGVSRSRVGQISRATLDQLRPLLVEAA